MSKYVSCRVHVNRTEFHAGMRFHAGMSHVGSHVKGPLDNVFQRFSSGENKTIPLFDVSHVSSSHILSLTSDDNRTTVASMSWPG